MYYLICSLTYCLHKFEKRTKNVFYCILKSIDIFTITSQKPAMYLVSKCADIFEQNSMRWIFLSRWGSKVPNFRTTTYVTLQQKSKRGGEGGGSLHLLACKVLRNSSCINLAYVIYKQRRISRNALLTKLHCRSYTSIIFKHLFFLHFYLS